jgi:hypothetical protein
MKQQAGRPALTRTLALALVAGAMGGLATTTAAAAAAAVKLPSPCPLAPAALVAAALGAPKADVHPRAQSSRSDGFPIETCIFTHAAALVTVTVAPAAYGSAAGSLPGMVTSHPTGLGPKGTFLHDARPGTIFASAVVVKGPLWADAYSNAHVPPGAVLTLGRYLYSHLP